VSEGKRLDLGMWETEDEIVIFWAGDEDDWLFRFKKRAGFAAREWADGVLARHASPGLAAGLRSNPVVGRNGRR
jgi:hypothetical protein